MHRPMVLGTLAAVIAILSAGIASWAIVKSFDVAGAQTRIERRVIRDERPTEAQLLQGILHALAVCHASPQCAQALNLAKRGISPRTGRPPVRNPNGPAFPSTGTSTSPPVTTPQQAAPPTSKPPVGASPPVPTGTSTSPAAPPPPAPPPGPLPPLPIPLPPAICSLLHPLCGAKVANVFEVPLI